MVSDDLFSRKSMHAISKLRNGKMLINLYEGQEEEHYEEEEENIG